MANHPPKHAWRHIPYRYDQFALNCPDWSPEAQPDIYVAGIGRFASRGDFDYRQVPHKVNLHIIQDGSGTMTQDQLTWEVSAGDVFAFFTGHPVHYADRPETPWRYTWIILDGRRVEESLCQVGLTPQTPLLRGDCFTRLDAILTDIQQTYWSEDSTLLYPVAAAWRLLSALSATVHRPSQHTGGDIVQAARFSMEHEYMTDLTVERLARRLGVTRSTLFRHFMAAFGVSPKQYMDRLRLDHAEHLLVHTALSIRTIARSCGFHSPHYFSRAFGVRCGLSPSDYRKQQPESPLPPDRS